VRIKGGLLGTGACGPNTPSNCWSEFKRQNLRKICWHSTPKSPTPTARSSTSRTILRAASQAATKCCGAKDCSKASGALDPKEGLSPGQAAEIDRVYAAYPEMNDDAFVRANIEKWLS
jgi:hypothetical protein